MIIKIENSPVKYKRYRAFMDNGKHYDFGMLGGESYLEHKDADKRRNYWARHYANPVEKIMIDTLTPSPSLFSAYLLWGSHSSLEKNVKELNDLWKYKHKKRN